MMPFRPIDRFGYALGAVALTTLPTVALGGDIAKGRSIAERHCARCHVVGDFNPTGGISSTPSFQMLVKRRPDYKDRFQTFFARRPHPAFLSIKGAGRLMENLPANAAPVELSQQDVADVAAFVETLKPDETDARQPPVVFRARPNPRVR